jgi:hypothetical protein
MRGGEFTVEPEPDSHFLSLVWREDGAIPVAMKVCDPRNDRELTRKTAQQFLMKWREVSTVEGEHPRLWS